MGHRHPIDKARLKLAEYIGGRHAFVATITTRSNLHASVGIERTTTRYLLKNVMLRSPGSNTFLIDHCWVACPFLDDKCFSTPCVIHFTAVVVPYVKLNFRASVGLAGIDDVVKA